MGWTGEDSPELPERPHLLPCHLSAYWTDYPPPLQAHLHICLPVFPSLSHTRTTHTNSHYSQLSMAECRNTLPLSLMHTLLHLQTSLCGSCGVEEVSPLQMTKNKTWIMEKWSTTDRNAIYPWNAPTEVCLIMLTSP